MKEYIVVSLSFLKQKAKQLKKEKSLSHHQALDEASKQCGYANYKHYLNTSKANRQQSEINKNISLKNIIAENIFSKKLELTVSYIQEFKPPFQEFLEVLKLFKNSKKAVQSVCEKTKLKDDIQAFLLNEFLESKHEIQSLPLKQHFIVKNVSVKNLTYELNAEDVHVSGDYDIAFEFEFEIPDEYTHLPHFNREPMFGDFEITIDRNKKMTIANSTIGEQVDGSFYMGSWL